MKLKNFAAIALAFSLLSIGTALKGQTRRASPASQSTIHQESSTMTTSSQLPPVPFTEFTLDNGLRVILHEDHSAPIVAVNIWYHVGSKNEVPGRTGFAHLFEHMMFQGSLHHDDDYFTPLQEAGGALNGSTNTDRTNYWEVVPSNFLELALWLESDRMGYLLDALTEKKLNNQREVVKNEKRQNYDNVPYGLVSAKIAETLYPPDHPYHWLTIGSLDDISAASRDDVADFFRRFYTPNNASLAIAGDINPQEARRLVEKYFGSIKRGPEVKKINPPPATLARETRVAMTDRVSLSRVYMVWPSVPQWTKNDAALDMLASVLAGGKGSRLYKSLVYEKQIAQDVFAFNGSREIAGQFQIVATAKPGKTLAELEQAINDEIAKVKSAPPAPDEMERAYNAREASFVYGLQTVGGFGGLSDQLNEYNTFLGKPGYFQEDLARFRSVTAADVTSMANNYLTDKRLVLTVTPRGRDKKTGGDVSPTAAANPSTAIASPAQQTAGTQTGNTTGAVLQTTKPGINTTSAQTTPPQTASAADRLAGAQTPTKAETSATAIAGAAPPQTTAARSGDKEQKKTTQQLGGLYAQPVPKPDPNFTLPRIERRKLSNGLDVLIVQQHELPVVSFNLVIKTGAAADPQERAGLASLTAALIDEGTKTRSALDISNQLVAIGARLGTGADWDSTGATLLTLTKHLERALDIYADVVANPSFPENELQLQRSSRLTALLQRRDNANAIAGLVYASLLYGRNHPYGHPLVGDELSLKAISRDDLRRFYETYYRPNNAALIVSGDVRPDMLLPQLERAFANWKSATIPAINVNGQLPARDKATIYLVDKPQAAQSVIAIGQIGVARSTPDYFPLLVMNTLLGGQFTSRVNLNLREDKGYTYGARTSFDYRSGPGPFIATAGVQTAVTKESVAEFLKELRGIRGARPVSSAELEYAKQALIRGFPRSFETPEQISARLEQIVLYSLPDDYFNNYLANVRRVTTNDVARVAERYLDPSKMAILVVGDRRVIEPGLRSLEDVGSTITHVDTEGHIVSGDATTGESDGGGGARP
jgi:predicted Zn-dependent peptidase